MDILGEAVQIEGSTVMKMNTGEESGEGGGGATEGGFTGAWTPLPCHSRHVIIPLLEMCPLPLFQPNPPLPHQANLRLKIQWLKPRRYQNNYLDVSYNT